MFLKRKPKTDLKKFSFFLLLFSCLFVSSVFPSDEIDLFDKTEGDSLKLAKAPELLNQDNILSNKDIDVPLPEIIIPSFINNTKGTVALSGWEGIGGGYSWKDAANWVGDVVSDSNDTVMSANGNSVQFINIPGYCYKLLVNI